MPPLFLEKRLDCDFVINATMDKFHFETAKEIMLAYGFQCKTGPIKIDNTDPAVARWVARYKRVFGNGDKIRKIS